MQPNISSKAVLDKVYRDLKPKDTTWEVDALEWIGEAIEYIGHHSGFVPKRKVLNVDSFRAALPCDYYAVRPRGVRKDGVPLVYGPNGHTYEPDDMATYISAKQVVLPSDNFTVTRYGSALVKGQSTSDYYQLQGLSYLVTSFEQGEVELLYYGFPMDEDGYPTIPNTIYYKEALFWYILAKMIMGGFIHPMFSYDYCDAKWKHYCTAAANDLSYPTPDKFQAFTNGWVRMIPNYPQRTSNDIE